MFHKIIIIIYGILMSANASVGLFTYYYKLYRPTASLRSPVSGDNITSTVPTPDTTTLIQNITSPAYANGTAISWISESFENFNALLTSSLEFLKLFTGSFIGDFLGSIGLPSEITYFIYVPLGLYTAYLAIVMLTNRGY